MAEKEFLSPAEVAHLLGVSRWTVYRLLLGKRHLRASRIGTQWRISREALDEYIRKTEVAHDTSGV